MCDISKKLTDSGQKFLYIIDFPPDNECKDIDECRHFNDSPGSGNISYLHPTFRNLPEDEWTVKSYLTQPCTAEESCINLLYKDGLGFKCVPKSETFAAVAIGGLSWNSEVDVLKADLNRCDGMIPKWQNKGSIHHKVMSSLSKDIPPFHLRN